MGSCYVSFFGTPYPANPNYNIISTDYDNYSIVYSCNSDKAYLWFLTRTPTISQDEYDAMYAIAYEALPNFNWNTWLPDGYQGPQCTYAAPTPYDNAAAMFLQ